MTDAPKTAQEAADKGIIPQDAVDNLPTKTGLLGGASGMDDEEEYDDFEGEEETPAEIPSDHDHVLSADEIIGIEDMGLMKVYVPHWKGVVVIKPLTQGQAGSLVRRATITKGKMKGNMDLARFSTLTFIEGVVDPKFDVASYRALKGKSAGAIAHVVSAITKASGMEDMEQVIMQAQENLENGQKS